MGTNTDLININIMLHYVFSLNYHRYEVCISNQLKYNQIEDYV